MGSLNREIVSNILLYRSWKETFSEEGTVGGAFLSKEDKERQFDFLILFSSHVQNINTAILKPVIVTHLILNLMNIKSKETIDIVNLYRQATGKELDTITYRNLLSKFFLQEDWNQILKASEIRDGMIYEIINRIFNRRLSKYSLLNILFNTSDQINGNFSSVSGRVFSINEMITLVEDYLLEEPSFYQRYFEYDEINRKSLEKKERKNEIRFKNEEMLNFGKMIVMLGVDITNMFLNDRITFKFSSKNYFKEFVLTRERVFLLEEPSQLSNSIEDSMIKIKDFVINVIGNFPLYINKYNLPPNFPTKIMGIKYREVNYLNEIYCLSETIYDIAFQFLSFCGKLLSSEGILTEYDYLNDHRFDKMREFQAEAVKVSFRDSALTVEGNTLKRDIVSALIYACEAMVLCLMFFIPKYRDKINLVKFSPIRTVRSGNRVRCLDFLDYTE